MMKTSKITKVTPNGSFTGNYGELFKFEVHFENGDYGDANCKTQNQTTWVVGQTVNYDLTPNANPKFNGKLSIVKEPFVPGGTTNNAPKNESVQRTIIAQSSISSAVEFLKHDSKITEKEILTTAGMFFEWVIKKGVESGS